MVISAVINSMWVMSKTGYNLNTEQKKNGNELLGSSHPHNAGNMHTTPYLDLKMSC